MTSAASHNAFSTVKTKCKLNSNSQLKWTNKPRYSR